MIHRMKFFCLAVLFPFLFAAATVLAAGSERSDLAFLDGLSLVVVDTDDISSLHVARRMVQSYGGTVAIMSPPSLLVGWVPFEAREALIGKASIREIYYTEVFPGEIKTGDPRSEAMVTFFNSAVRGDLAAEFEETARAAAADPAPTPRQPDVLTPEQFDRDDYLENLRAAGVNLDALAERGIVPDLSSPEATGNSDFMTGTVALTIFFVESDGSGSDPNLYTWTAPSMQSYLNGVATALIWWSNQAQSRGDCWATFLINYYSGADPRCQQWVEPILHDTSYENTWVTEIMTNFGYTAGSRFSRVTAFNTWQRSYYQTDRSYSAFIPYNPPPAPSSFIDGHTAYAYWYGPYTVLLFRVQGWTIPQVFAHESGHIFGACDEYTGGCGPGSCGSICTNGTLNGNCEACNPDSRDCMMKANSFSLCTYTTRHVGWEVNTPCAPPEPPLLPSPGLASVSPSHGGHGTKVDLTVTGTHFYPGIDLYLGDDVFVHTLTLTGETTIHANIEILGSAPPGLRDIRVMNRDGQYTTLPGAFEVQLTTRHYYSPAGGNNAPYVLPAEAATTLQDAIKATYDCDTLFVSGQFDNFSIYIDRGVLLHGGWNSTFTSRNLETGKTVLDLNGNVTFSSAAGGAGLDGFLLRYGTGAGALVPFNAIFGGAVRFSGGAAIVSNCEIHSSSAGGSEYYGVGGAIFANGCAVDIRDNSIHNNSATQGGAIYLLDCSGTVANNTISTNTVHAAAQPAIGAGIVLMNPSDLTLSGNVIQGNTLASQGGGLYVENGAGILMSGGTISGNQASFSGGGILVQNTTITIEGVEVLDNASTTVGGGIFSDGGSHLTIDGASFTSNTALLGAGIYAGSGHFALRHSLFVQNNALNMGGAILVSAVQSGEVVGNVLDGNTSPSGGGMFLGVSAGEVYNNIIVNSSGTGLSCNGGPPALLAYNLVWGNSGGNYTGCTPGVGSLSDDPLFIDPVNGDYHVGIHSPAIDAGRPGTGYQDPDGSRGDMGIYGSHPFAMDQPSYPKNVTATRDGEQLILEWSANPEADVAEYAVYGDLSEDFVPGLATFITLVAGTDSSATLELPPDSLYYRVSAVDTDGYAGGYSPPVLYSPTTTAVHHPPESYAFALRQNVPNPFNPSTRIAYEIPSRTPVALSIYDVDGRLVRRLVEEVQGPGSFTVTWEGRNDEGRPVASGVYFYRLTAGSDVKTRKMVFLK